MRPDIVRAAFDIRPERSSFDDVAPGCEYIPRRLWRLIGSPKMPHTRIANENVRIRGPWF
jgi:hypothetical protein